MSFEAIITNTVNVVNAAGFSEAHNRFSLEQQAEGGADRRFQVEAQQIAEDHPWLGIGQNRRSTRVSVRIAYFRGGGDMGGEPDGGDRRNVNARAVTDTLRLASFLTNPTRYDSAKTGINRVVQPEARKVLDLKRSEIWELSTLVVWEENESSRAVPA